jgi:hypothetical protein
MNKYSVVLHSNVSGSDVWINFLVNTPMTSKQLQTYYECLSLSISKVDVVELNR